MDWTGVITGILTLIGVLLKLWIDNAPQRQKEAYDAAIEKGREDIAAGNVDAVNARADKLLSDGCVSSEGRASSDSADGQHSDESTAERFQKILDS